MSVPAVLVRKSTKQIIKEDIYPRADMGPVQGMDPDYEWLVKNIPFPEPPYDSRIYIMQTNLPDLQYLSSFIEHPSYPGIREYRITYSPEKRSNEDIVRAVLNAEKSANDIAFPENVHKDQMTFMLNSVHKDAKGLELTIDEQDVIDKLATYTVKLSKNRDNAIIKIAQIESGQEPNIDTGWEN